MAETRRLRLIGELGVIAGGAELPMPASRKTRALLAYLAATGKAHRRERLCELFWDVPDDPRGALRWSLSKLRALLGDALCADRETVRLDTAALASDLEELRRHAATGLSAPTEELERLASGLGRGFCEGLDLPRCGEFEAWCAALREDVRRMEASLLAALLERLDSEPERALPFARRRVELDPLDEAARIDLVERLVRAGRAEEAERQRTLAIAALHDAGIDAPGGLSRPAGAPERTETAPPPAVGQRVRFCTAADGTGLAFSLAGEGPPLVKTANWMNHLEFEWESPILRHWMRELSRDHQLLRYDARGNGLSDRQVEDLSFEALVSDLESVVDAAGCERFDLIGISQGAAVAVAYAVRHPQRLKRLVLVGGYPTGWAERADPEEMARREAMLTLTRAGWGQDNPAYRQMFTGLYFPDATPDEAASFNELQRLSVSPEGAERMQRVLSRIDVRPLLPKVRTPTLVFHARDDAMVPFAAGRELAACIPGAEFVALDSRNHILLEHERAWPRFVERLRAFLCEPQSQARA